ncbi:hypothetical protein AVEN_195880-1 [Araneus ventricosus]|uniref:Uncharacterized protein n=1 Tax=Araneus ventricosus TaxID=182803 RepID=A0A4Y2DWE9_ARAVE|nr:hypothetical protein AVEN_195880-1 [Araneus ventricosus]
MVSESLASSGWTGFFVRREPNPVGSSTTTKRLAVHIGTYVVRRSPQTSKVKFANQGVFQRPSLPLHWRRTMIDGSRWVCSFPMVRCENYLNEHLANRFGSQEYICKIRL